jgi:hypothetical protein
MHSDPITKVPVKQSSQSDDCIIAKPELKMVTLEQFTDVDSTALHSINPSHELSNSCTHGHAKMLPFVGKACVVKQPSTDYTSMEQPCYNAFQTSIPSVSPDAHHPDIKQTVTAIQSTISPPAKRLLQEDFRARTKRIKSED